MLKAALKGAMKRLGFEAAPQTLAASFQVMLALSQSSLVRGWLKLSATQTLAASFQVIPALLQSSLVKGCRKTPVESVMHTFALSFDAISPLSQSARVKDCVEMFSVCP